MGSIDSNDDAVSENGGGVDTASKHIVNVDDTIGESLFRVATRRHCDVIVTPLATMAVAPLLNAFYSDVSQQIH